MTHEKNDKNECEEKTEVRRGPSKEKRSSRERDRGTEGGISETRTGLNEKGTSRRVTYTESSYRSE